MAWEDWQNEKKAAIWNGILDILEDEARRFSIDRRGEASITVSRARWDTPSIELRWGAGDVYRCLHAVVNGADWPLEIEFSGAVWQDRDRPEGRERRWKSEKISSRSCRDASELAAHVRQDFDEAFRVVSALAVADGKVTRIPAESASSRPHGRATSAD